MFRPVAASLAWPVSSSATTHRLCTSVVGNVWICFRLKSDKRLTSALQAGHMHRIMLLSSRTSELQHGAAVAAHDAVGIIEGQLQGVDVLLDGRCRVTEACIAA